eukprot:m.24150 g.24150  ORF g.24150 m.24150 type:complete len:289 (-) comp14482_c1_seq1:281-1147(-)
MAVVVTGAAGAIGAACSRILLATHSTRVVLAVDARLNDNAFKTSLLHSLGLSAACLQDNVFETINGQRLVTISNVGNFMDESSVQEAMNQALQDHVQDGGLSGLISVAGGNPPGVDNVSYAPPGATPPSMYHDQFNFNFISAANMVNACMDSLVRGKGSIVLTSSVNGTLGIGETAYAVAKAGLHSLARNLATTYGRDGVTCNAVALGTVVSPNIWGAALNEDPEILAKIGNRNPRGVVGSADEAANILCFLASDASKLINGEIITADGGWSIAAGTVTGDPNKRWFD